MFLINIIKIMSTAVLKGLHYVFLFKRFKYFPVPFLWPICVESQIYIHLNYNNKMRLTAVDIN